MVPAPAKKAENREVIVPVKRKRAVAVAREAVVVRAAAVDAESSKEAVVPVKRIKVVAVRRESNTAMKIIREQFNPRFLILSCI